MRFDFRALLVLGALLAGLMGCSDSKDQDDSSDRQSNPATGDDDNDDDTQATTKDAGKKPASDAGSTPARPLDAGHDAGHALDAGSNDAQTSVGHGDSSSADASTTSDTSAQGSPTTDYMPCPTSGDPCKILPLGDSITVGLEDPAAGGYRLELFKLTHADGKNITFVGSQHGGPSMVDGAPFPTNHEGYSGWTITQIAGLIPSPALRDSPNIILLMAGTNDVAWAGPDGAPMRLGMLIDSITAAAPDALLVVAQITPLGDAASEMRVETFNQAVPDIVKMRATAGKHVSMVDMHTGFPSSGLSFDQVHPDPEGYKFMAGVWYKAISAVLP